MLTEEELLFHINTFIDPLSGKGLANRVTGFMIKGGHVSFAIMAPIAHQETFVRLAKELESSLKGLQDIQSRHVIVTNERTAPQALPPLEKIKKIIAVGSGKGGVGKSTVALNIADGLSKKGLTIGLLDADIHGPSIPTMLNLTESLIRKEKTFVPFQVDALKVMSIGFMIPDHASLVWRGPMLQKALIQMLWGVNWGSIDILVIDLPPGTGDIPLTLCQKAPLSGAIIVSTPQDLSLLDARRAVDMFRKVNTPILGIIENMSIFTCPHCGEISPIFDKGGVKKEARSLEIPLLGEIPLMIELREKKRLPRLFESIIEKISKQLLSE